MNAFEKFKTLPEREQKKVLARAWIMANDDFLFPLKDESPFEHHARILTVYASQYADGLSEAVRELAIDEFIEKALSTVVFSSDQIAGLKAVAEEMKTK